jgi:hypothetical protein
MEKKQKLSGGLNSDDNEVIKNGDLKDLPNVKLSDPFYIKTKMFPKTLFQYPTTETMENNRKLFLEYIKKLMEIHGESMFGEYEATTKNLIGDQKIILQCWGCNSEGYKLWSESWRKHFEHEKECEYVKICNELNALDPNSSH